MTQQSEKNKVIAEFMKLKPFEDSRYGKMYPNPLGQLAGGSIFGDEGLKYHTSWDWLMPVFSKINTIVKDLQAQVKFLNYDPYYQRIYGAILEVNITAAHEAIYSFIEWYEEVARPVATALQEYRFKQ